MSRTRLQLEADRHVAALRRALADDLRRLRIDAGVSQAAAARVAGLDPSLVSRIESSDVAATLESYGRLAAALGADLAARVYPQSGPAIRDRHQVRMAEGLLSVLHPRWRAFPEVAVRRPIRGWIDLALHDPTADLVVATEIESWLRRVEQLVRWSVEKAAALASSSHWAAWTRSGEVPQVSRLLVVRWTRANRDAVAAGRRTLREVYPADPRDALDALTGSGRWPGAALVWARVDARGADLVPG